MRELFINYQAIDLYPNENIALTKQRNTLNELKNRQADYSNQFKIPATPNNIRVCGMLHVVGSDSINPYTKLPGSTYIENGSELISNGVAIIEEFNGAINVTLYSGIYDFFNTIGDDSLRDLDLSDSNHVFNLTNATANTSDKYSYPLIQWGATDKNNDIVDIRFQMPVLKAPYLIDKIFETAQYQKSGDVFGLQSYQNLVIPVVEDEIINEDDILESYSVIAHIEDTNVYNSNTTPQSIVFDYFGSGDAVDSTAGWYSGGKYIAQNKVSVNVNFSAFVFIPSVTITKNILGQVLTIPDISITEFQLLLNGVVIDTTGQSIRGGFGLGLVELSSQNLNMNAGDILEVRVVFHNTFLFTFLEFPPFPVTAPNKQMVIYHFSVTDYSFFSVEATNTIELNQTIDFNNLVPDIKQKDLIKDLMIAYCLVPQFDPLTRTIEFIQFDKIGEKANLSYIEDNGLCADWSDKLDLKIAPKIRYRFDSYAQINYLKWLQDDDRGEVGIGNILIDDTTLPDKTDLFTTTFAASIQELNFKGNTGVNIKRYTRFEAEPYSSTQDYNAGDLALYNGIVYEAIGSFSNVIPTDTGSWMVKVEQFEKTESVAPRLLLIRDYISDAGSPPSNILNYTDGTTTVEVTNAKIAYFVDPLQGYDLSFQFIINEHYQTLVRVLTKTKIVDAYFKLSDNDFKNIDFFEPIYIEYFGNYFYLNQGTNYISGRLTSCELVRL
jgi:hypothetical protein